jgi:hypothetical protein
MPGRDIELTIFRAGEIIEITSVLSRRNVEEE